MVHDAASIRACSFRLILSLATAKRYKVFSHDVNQTDVHSKPPLSPKGFLPPKKKT